VEYITFLKTYKMGIESTQTVKKSDALIMLSSKGVKVFSDDSNNRLAELLYENRESIFNNYSVVDDDYEAEKYERLTSSW
jgi:hypothetical protein